MRNFTYSTQAPPPPLAAFVDHFWSLSDAPSHSMERILPTGTSELVINLHEDEFRIHKTGSSDEKCTRFRGAIVSGAYSRPFVAETRAHASIVGVHFKPGGVAAILGVPAHALANAHAELGALWGHRAIELRDRLCAAADPAQRFRILEQALLGRLCRSPHIRGEIVLALGRLGAPGVNVGDVARQVQLSHRRFIELFTQHIGMTPKRYSKVRRFQRAVELAASDTAPPWAEVALISGYFDQAHLCRDWVELSGFSPAEFLGLRSVRVKDNHVALPEPRRSNFSNTAPLAARNLSANGGQIASNQR